MDRMLKLIAFAEPVETLPVQVREYLFHAKYMPNISISSEPEVRIVKNEVSMF